AVSFFVFDSMPSTTKSEQRWFVFAPLNLSKDSSSVKVSAWWRLCSMALVRVWIRSRWNPSCRLTLGLHLTPRARPVWILKIIGAAPVRPDVRKTKSPRTMSEMIPTPEPGRNAPRWGWLIMIMIGLLVCIVFGVLMGIVRERLNSQWWRAAVAGCAFGILALLIAQIRKLRG